MSIALLVVAALFAVVAGANDGSSILASAVRVSGLRPWVSISILLAAVVLGPLVLFGTSVATTLAHRLVPFDARGGVHVVLLVAALAAMLVVFGLSRAGLPTSLTLALVGGISGAGWGGACRSTRACCWWSCSPVPPRRC
jgi:PiT family inorganic phosphate transporter